MRRRLSFLWFASMIVLQIYFNYKSQSSAEYQITSLIYMTLLTFPIGLIVLLLWFGLEALRQSMGMIWLTTLLNGQMGDLLLWLAFTVAGYYQWFVLLPQIIDKRKKHKE